MTARAARSSARDLTLVACALACVVACARNDAERSGAQDLPTLVAPRTPGQPIVRKPALRPRAKDGQTGARTPAPTQLARIRGDGYSGWLRPAMSAQHWRPSEVDIAAMEAHIPVEFAAAGTRGEVPEGLDLGTYERQYNGYLLDPSKSPDEAGRKVIEVHFFCADSKHLAKQFMQIQGGGACFLHTAYETGARRFRYWRANRK